MKILVIGAGVMSNFLIDSINNSEHIFVGRVDLLGNGEFNSFEEVNEDFDVIIDFSNKALLEKSLEFAKLKNKNILIATTGHDEKDMEIINKYSNYIAILKATNTSFGVNAVNMILEYATKLLKNFDIELIESHHNRKLDAPSGTAETMLDIIDKALNKKLNRVYGRKDEKRGIDEIGVHSIRGGSIVGEHKVIFTKGDEIIEIKHTALSRKIFSDGAIFVVNKLSILDKGLYFMSDFLKN